MNTVVLSGNLTKEPELRTTPQGTETCSFTVAVKRNFKNSKGEYDADFISCVAWRQTATFIHNYFRKGSGIEIEGSIRAESWEKDGKKSYRTYVLVNQVEFGKGGKASEAKAETKPAESYEVDDELVEYEPIDDPNLPF